MSNHNSVAASKAEHRRGWALEWNGPDGMNRTNSDVDCRWLSSFEANNKLTLYFLISLGTVSSLALLPTSAELSKFFLLVLRWIPVAVVSMPAMLYFESEAFQATSPLIQGGKKWWSPEKVHDASTCPLDCILLDLWIQTHKHSLHLQDEIPVPLGKGVLKLPVLRERMCSKGLTFWIYVNNGLSIC